MRHLQTNDLGKSDLLRQACITEYERIFGKGIGEKTTTVKCKEGGGILVIKESGTRVIDKVLFSPRGKIYRDHKLITEHLINFQTSSTLPTHY